MAKLVNSETISGEAIIEAYHSGDVDGAITYGKLCKAVDLLDHWQPQAVVEFLQQFVDAAYLLDHRCKQLVQKFARIEWQSVPGEVRPLFVKLLRDIGVHHICHTETIIRCFVEHLLAKVQPVVTTDGNDEDTSELAKSITKFELCVTSEEQDCIFQLAQDGLVFLLNCLPVATKIFKKIVRHCFPHFSTPIIRYVSYLRNLILICENIPHCRRDVLSVAVDGLSQIDAVIGRNEDSDTRKDAVDTSLNIFLMDEECETKRNDVDDNYERVEKLDICMYYVFAYIARAHSQQFSLEINTNWMPATCLQEKLFDELLDAFEDHLLMAHNLRNISFLWFYMCSLDKNYQTSFLNWLWSFIRRVSQSPNDWKKAQGAACYIGSFLSRASYVDIDVTMEWLERLLHWCTCYVNEMVDRTAGAAVGSARHGTFYAVFQAFLITFSFRYREIFQAEKMDKIHHWGLGHVVHSTLEPLSYISRPVALCFATISRSVQLVYVNHILPPVPEEKLPFEPHFPFDSYCLTRSLPFIATLMRKFSPLAEDTNAIKSELLWKNANEEMDSHTLEENIGSWEFLEDLTRDRMELQKIGAEIMDFAEEKTSSFKAANEFLTVYSTSPGLKQFKTSHFLDPQ